MSIPKQEAIELAISKLKENSIKRLNHAFASAQLWLVSKFSKKTAVQKLPIYQWNTSAKAKHEIHQVIFSKNLSLQFQILLKTIDYVC